MSADLPATLRLRYVLVGRSGSGKTTMARHLEEELGLKRCVTYTTRPPRAGEVAGKDYYFASQLDKDLMFECSRFGQYWYGTSWGELSQSDFIILEPQGVAYYREHFPGPLTVIQLERSNIAVSPERMLRDRKAGFESVHPDLLITGDTVQEMKETLFSAILALESSRRRMPLTEQIQAAEEVKARQSKAENPRQEAAPTR